MSLWATLAIGFVHRIFLTCFMRKAYLLCYATADNAFDTHFEINMHILALFFTQAISDTPTPVQPCSGKKLQQFVRQRCCIWKVCIDPVQRADETLQLLGNLSAANRDCSPPGTKYPFEERSFDKKVSVWLWSGKKTKQPWGNV